MQNPDECPRCGAAMQHFGTLHVVFICGTTQRPYDGQSLGASLRTTPACDYAAKLRRERDALQHHYDAASGPDHNLLALLDLYDDRRATAERERDEARDACYYAREGLRELTAAHVATLAELERWRHSVTVEGDFVCPDSVALSDARREVERLRSGICSLNARVRAGVEIAPWVKVELDSLADGGKEG